MSRASAAVVLVTLLAAAGAGSDEPSLAGKWRGGFEGAGFQPAGEREIYHSAGSDDELWALVPVHENGYAIETCLDVVLQGTVEGPGSYGHLGAFPYQFVVSRVLSAKRSETPVQECIRF